ncbi:MAG: DUF2442 domain-containing protein [Flavobacteriaceae bacterium]|jgi:hypothetical protein|nr:DUF2442 domain-containing protein [Flavobacteriaceae bacterium]
MNKIIPYLKTAKALSGYRLWVEFDDGVDGVIDLHEWKGKGVFEAWNDERNFQSFKITDHKKIEWSEDIDMDPDAFYLQLINKTFQEYADNQQFLRYSH